MLDCSDNRRLENFLLILGKKKLRAFPCKLEQIQEFSLQFKLMDVGIIDVEDRNMALCATVNGSASTDGRNRNADENSLVQDDEGIIEPQLGMEFESEQAARNFYNAYARHLGFSTKISQSGRSKLDGQITVQEYVCSKDGSKRRSSDSCDAMLRIELKGNRWLVTRFVKDHSHALMSSSSVHHLPPRRHFAGSAKNVAETFQAGAIAPSRLMYPSMDGNHTLGDVNHRIWSVPPIEPNPYPRNLNSVNYAVRPVLQRRTLGKDAQNVLDYFRRMQAEKPGFFYAVQLDEESRIVNAFWADARSRTAYRHFGDAVILDTSYRVNQYNVPFAPFTGVNHHGQTILFACVLLLDDSEASFSWLFKTFLMAMHDQAPVSIITDQDRTIRAAVSQVFPKSRHCINKWHILREGQERLAHVCLAHPNFQVKLYNCINLTETIEEFESSWTTIIDKYDLKRNDWLKSLYNARREWVPVYFRDSFFAAISLNQSCNNSFFDGYINQQTTLPIFFRQYESAMENWLEKEREADFDTTCNTPLLKTPSPMEKQVANLYTRKIFSKFQEELVETFVYTANRIDGDDVTSTFRVAKFEDDHKVYIVTLNIPDLRASCSCKMFEHSGILCRHILTVFTVTNVLTLPSHYILKRWTRTAKSGGLFDEHVADHGQESMASRFKNLCLEAIRYAEEGALTPETYNTALAALREGGEKLSMMKWKIPRVVSTSSQASSVGRDDKPNAADMPNLLWPQQDEWTRRVNLNNCGVAPYSVPELHYPRMAPVSLHRDDGASDNMAVLPCLKSMTWVMENKNSSPENRVAVINLKLLDYSKTPAGESEVKFQLSRLTLEPMMRSMAHINDQLSTPANRVAVINLKLQELDTNTGESEVKFQVSRDTLGAMLRSMAYIGEQLSNKCELQLDPPSKRRRK